MKLIKEETVALNEIVVGDVVTIAGFGSYLVVREEAMNYRLQNLNGKSRYCTYSSLSDLNKDMNITKQQVKVYSKESFGLLLVEL